MLTDGVDPGGTLDDCRRVWSAAENRTVGEKGVLRHGDDGFYALAKQAYITIRTGETAPFSCYLIPKGVL